MRDFCVLIFRIVGSFDLRRGGRVLNPSSNRATVQPLRPWEDLKLIGQRVAEYEPCRPTLPVLPIAKHAGINGSGNPT